MSKAAKEQNKADLLEQIRADILKQNVCPDLAKQATNLVMGDGSPDAEVVFVGEAPGKNEDLQGLPFVGAAGKFLDEMLSGVGLKRQDVYITNIVKYRPANNRDPLPSEKKAFWPFLLKQIDVIRPKIIATLGRHSMEYFLPGKRISETHGQPKRIRVRLPASQVGSQDVDGVQGSKEKRMNRINDTKSESRTQLTKQSATKLGRTSGSARRQDELVLVILPLFHPAAALYNGSMRETLIEDFRNLPQIMKLIKE